MNKQIVNYQRKKKIDSHNMYFCEYCDAQILWFSSHIADFTINSSPEQFMFLYLVSLYSLTIKT